MPLAELHEDAAAGEAAAIYAALRQALGIPVVNLIWRHFATLPGVLPWAWATVAPVAQSAEPRLGAARLRALVAALPVPALPALTEAQQAVVATYNRGNCANLLLLTALRRLLEGAPAGHGPALPAAEPPAMLPAMLPLPRLDALDAGTAARLGALAALHGGTDAVPSLYRHLALWPGLLAPLHAALAGAPAIAQGRDALLAEAAATAAQLLPALRPPGPCPPAQRAAVLAVLDVFTGRLIAEMATVGLLLNPR